MKRIPIDFGAVLPKSAGRRPYVFYTFEVTGETPEELGERAEAGALEFYGEDRIFVINGLTVTTFFDAGKGKRFYSASVSTELVYPWDGEA